MGTLLALYRRFACLRAESPDRTRGTLYSQVRIPGVVGLGDLRARVTRLIRPSTPLIARRSTRRRRGRGEEFFPNVFFSASSASPRFNCTLEVTSVGSGFHLRRPRQPQAQFEQQD